MLMVGNTRLKFLKENWLRSDMHYIYSSVVDFHPDNILSVIGSDIKYAVIWVLPDYNKKGDRETIQMFVI